MLRLFRTRAAVTAASFVFALSACGTSGSAQSAFTDQDSIMRYVPADTPYLLATGEQLPDDLLDKLEPQLDVMMGAYRTMILAALSSASEDSESEMSEEDFERISEMMVGLTSLMSVQGMRDAGFERDSRGVFFGHGLLPVLRLEVSDEQKFETALAQVEEAVGHTMDVGDVDGESYRYVGGDGGRIVIGVFDGSAVFTFFPEVMGDDELKQLLGLTLPSQSIAATSILSDIADTYDYTDHYIGMIDVVRLVSTFVDTPTGLDAELLSAFEYDNSELTDVCKAEILETAAVAPRMVMGYNSIDAEDMTGSFVVELRDDIASGLSTLAAVVPGLGTDPGGLMSMGFSFDLGAFRTFLEARIDAIDADPYECELFAELQMQLEQGREALNQPLPPMAYAFRGVNAVVDDIDGLDILSGQTPSPDAVDASVLIAMEDAQMVVAMGAMVSPEIASLGLQPDGEPVELILPQVQAMGVAAFAAMTADSVAISIGSGAEQRVTEVLEADAVEPPPVFALAMDAGRYYELIAQAMMMDEDDEMPPEAREAARDMLLAVGEIYDRLAIDVRFTSNGLEMDSKVTLSE